jgi:hypothetical protein
MTTRMSNAVVVLVLALVGALAYSDFPSKQMATVFGVIAFLAGVRIAYLMARDGW